MDDELKEDPEIENLSWDANALLMAIDEDSEKIYEEILQDSENPGGVLMMATATMKAMVDFLLEIVNQSGVTDVPLKFGDLVRLTAQHLTAKHADD